MCALAGVGALLISFGIALFCGLIACAPKSAIAPIPAAKVLYRKPLSKDSELVVTEEPRIPVSDLTGLYIASSKSSDVVSFTSLNIELRTASGATLRLWSQRGGFDVVSVHADYEVLDILVQPNRIVAALAGPRSFIVIADVPLSGDSRHCGLSSEWCQLGALVPTRPGRLHAKLSYDGTENRVEVEVTDSLGGRSQHTSYRQKRDEWDFAFFKQWEEVPATRPAYEH